MEPSHSQHDASPVPETAHSAVAGFTAAVLLIGLAFVSIRNAVEAAAEQAVLKHQRAELRDAYKKRGQWKKSDITYLKTLKLNRYALARIEHLSGTGRPSVKAHRPLEEVIISAVSAFNTAYDPASDPRERLKALRTTYWWPHYVEAMYRGEHSRAKQARERMASVNSEIAVGRALGMSASTVHTICGEIRRKRREWDGAANFPPMTLVEFEEWMQTGKCPHDI